MLLDKLKTRLRDIVFGKTRISVVNTASLDLVTPVFVVGTFRSGTTLFRYLLDSHQSICCPPETKFLEPVANIRMDSHIWGAIENIGLDEGYVRKQIQTFATSIYGPYLASKNKSILVDKTPEYVRNLEFIDWLYEGRCKYLLIFRNGLDVAQSMMEQEIQPLGENKTLDEAFAYWKQDTEIMLDWFERKNSSCHKVVYDKLCTDTESTMRGVFDFMEVGWDSAVDDWHRKQHDRGYEDIKARRQRSINVSRHNYLPWDDERILRFKQRATDTHNRVGYDPDTLEYIGP